MTDPDVLAWAEGPAPDAEAAYRKAAAVAALEARAAPPPPSAPAA